MSTEPSAEDKARYEAIRKELIQALPKKRAIDKQLVREASGHPFMYAPSPYPCIGPNRSSDLQF